MILLLCLLIIDDTTNLLQELHQVEKELRKAEKSLRLNPFGRNKKQQLKQNEHFLFQLKHGYTYISGALPTFNDWSETNSLRTVDGQKWAVQLQVLGEYITEQANKNVENYSIKKSSFDLLDLSSIPLQISIPPELESHRYQLSLYNDTLKLIDKLKAK